MCVAFKRTGVVRSSQKLHRRDRVHAVTYGCRHTRAMCGGRFADGGAPPRVTPWSARLLATATGVSGRRVDPGPWAIAGRPRYVAPRKADRFEVSAGPHDKGSVAEPEDAIRSSARHLRRLRLARRFWHGMPSATEGAA